MDNVGSWVVLFVITMVALIAFFIKGVNEYEARRDENERFWEEHGWGD